MADSLEGLGTAELFPLVPNWVVTPTTNLVVGRYYQTYPGSSFIIEELTGDVPQVLELGFMLEKEDEYSLLDFFNDRKGRLERFWVRDPKQSFILKETATLGSTVLKCYPNKAEEVMRGDERIWIEMTDGGDIITRELTDVSYNTGDDATYLQMNTTIDRDLTADNGNHLIIGKLLLARFGYDTMEISLQSNLIGETNLRFRELVKEYVDE